MLNRICRFPSADNKGKQLKLTYVLLLSQLFPIGLDYMQFLPQGQEQYHSISNKGRVILMISEPPLDFLTSVGLHQMLSGPSGRG